jgi:dolichol-phosphate mannosyltransferase
MLTLVLPTYNEAENLPELVRGIERALEGLPFEVIIVDDDSPDRTWEVAERLARDHRRLRVLRRVGRRGLSSAVMEGFEEARGDVLIVMDADGQHDPRLLPDLAGAVRRGSALAIGSRYVEGGSVRGWHRSRHILSRLATRLAHAASRVRVSDPMSGFFAIDRNAYAKIKRELQPTGFKILLEILAHLPCASRVSELPLVFGLRKRGESKLTPRVQLQFLRQVLSLALARWQRTVFAVASVAIAIILLFQLWPIRLLYLDPDVRARVRSGLLLLNANEGWLLSDIDVRSVSRDRAVLTHRFHMRGRDPAQCVVMSLDTFQLSPCRPS